MISVRALRCAAPRPVRLFALTARRVTSPVHRSESFSTIPRTNILSPRRLAAFSTSTLHAQAPTAPSNEELVAKLESELGVEKEIGRDPNEMPDHIREYIENSSFQIVDTPGQEEVKLERTLGDETITVTFSISDLNNQEDEADSMEDSSMLDEFNDDPTDLPEEGQSGGGNTKGAINQGRSGAGNIRVAPEDKIAPADREELAEDSDAGAGEQEQDPSFPAHVFITVNRPGRGALQVEAIAQDGLMVIDNVNFYQDGKLADPAAVEGEFAARNLYTGPPFGNLDEDLQVLFEKYLDERDINTTMALFIPEYIDFKEQREYLNWLQGVKSFVE